LQYTGLSEKEMSYVAM